MNSTKEEETLSETLVHTALNLLSAAHTAGINEGVGELLKQEKQKPQTYRIILDYDMPSSVADALSPFKDGFYAIRFECTGFVIDEHMFMAYGLDGIALFLLPYKYILTIVRSESDV
jgi:hypothetical protein